MKKYEQIDISGDVGLKIWGNTIEELFENAAEGMFTLITDISTIDETEEREIILSAESREGLLIQWLNELVFLFDTYGFTGKRFNVELSSNKLAMETRDTDVFELNAKILGGIFSPEVNESRLLIKAATYHGLSIEKLNSHWKATVIFDI
jgi:SHS2 domain-containing protein